MDQSKIENLKSKIENGGLAQSEALRFTTIVDSPDSETHRPLRNQEGSFPGQSQIENPKSKMTGSTAANPKSQIQNPKSKMIGA